MKIPLHGPNEQCLPGWSNTSLSGSVNLRRSPGGLDDQKGSIERRAMPSYSHGSWCITQGGRA